MCLPAGINKAIIQLTMILGIDIGTTNVKILAMRPGTNELAALVSAPLTTLTPEPDRAEQDSEVVWQTVKTLIAKIIGQLDQTKYKPETVCFSAGMHSLLAVDGQGKPLTNALLWSDNRAEAQADVLRGPQAALGRDIYRRTGTPIHPMLPLCKLAWFAEHQPHIGQQAARWISLKEYIWWKLTGRYQIDWSMATATGLFDPILRSWYRQSLAYAGIRANQLSELQPTTYQLPYKPNRAGVEQTALPAGTLLMIGASDGCLANLGAGAIGTGVTTITIGTSGAVRRTVNQPLRDPNGRLFCYWLTEQADTKTSLATPYYVVGGPTNNGGNVLEWLCHQFAPGLSAADVLAEAATAPPGSDGLLFYPYLHGERAPLWDAHVRGSFVGIDARHKRGHFLRAALEGVLLNLMQIDKQLAQLCGPTQVIHANGGFAQSAFWVQMLADIAGVPVKLNASNESAGIGAVLLAETADTSTPTSLETLASRVPFGQTFQPDPATHAVYAKSERTKA